MSKVSDFSLGLNKSFASRHNDFCENSNWNSINFVVSPFYPNCFGSLAGRLAADFSSCDCYDCENQLFKLISAYCSVAIGVENLTDPLKPFVQSALNFLKNCPLRPLTSCHYGHSCDELVEANMPVVVNIAGTENSLSKGRMVSVGKKRIVYLYKLRAG